MRHENRHDRRRRGLSWDRERSRQESYARRLVHILHIQDALQEGEQLLEIPWTNSTIVAELIAKQNRRRGWLQILLQKGRGY